MAKGKKASKRGAGTSKAVNQFGDKRCSMPIVGVGASAGGLEALRGLFSRFDGPVGTAFVIVQHMAPKYRSLLAELLSRDAHLEVQEIAQDEDPRPNVVYVTPPNADIVLQKGRLHLVEPDERIGPKPSIDRFFLSLASELGDRCGGIILSGTGSDGAQGIRAIKDAGGLTLAQSPQSAKYDGMPRAAIGTGSIDTVLSTNEMAAQLPGMIKQLLDPARAEESQPSADAALKSILETVHRATKVNFALYKPNTIRRRLERRMNATHAQTLGEYAAFLQANPDEVQRFFRDALISVTSFFRDMDQYQRLTPHLEELIKAKSDGEPLRIWCAGCATGEESYSLGILVTGILRQLKRQMNVQIFATDVSEDAMAVARRGVYPRAALEKVKHPDLETYFRRQDDTVQVKKGLREMVVFAKHDLIQDPPFLKVDLISCRNVFIYFDQEVQDRILKTFHYALNPDGLLFLGKSEAIGALKPFFGAVDGTAKIFRRVERVADPAATYPRATSTRQESSLVWPARRDRSVDAAVSELIKSFAPHSVVIDDAMTVQSVHGEARRVLQIPDGMMLASLEMLLKPELKNKIITLTHRAKRSQEIAQGGHVAVGAGAKKRMMQVCVYPIEVQHQQRYVVSFVPVEKDERQVHGQKPTNREFDELQRELAATREHLQTVIEEQETSNEELQALNEELQSANEELQSTNEELETSNEELQSTNEELTTLNEEMNVKSAELVGLSNHLSAIQDAVPHPILVLDRNFNLSRFNHQAETTLHITNDDLQRNLRLLPKVLELRGAIDAAEEALKSGVATTQQICTDGLDYDARCEPIRDHRDQVTGVVMTLVDNSKMSTSLRQAQAAENSLIKILSNIPAAVSVKDASGRYTFVNEEFDRLTGKSAVKVLGKTDEEIFGVLAGTELRGRDLETLKRRHVLRMEESLDLGDGRTHVLLSSRVPLVDAQGAVSSVCAVSVDVTERAEASRRLQLFKEVITSSKEGLLVFEEGQDGEFRVNFASVSFESLAGLKASELAGRGVLDILKLLAPDVTARNLPALARGKGDERASFPLCGDRNGQERWYEVRLSIFQPRNAGRQLLMIVLDDTEKKEQERLIHNQQEEILRAGKLASLGEMAAGIAHELNTPLNTIQAHVDLVRQLSSASQSLPEHVTTSLDSIETTVGKISDIIVGLKSIARTSKERDMLPCDLETLIREVMKICELHLRNRGVRLELELGHGPVKVMGHATQLMQVLINLVNNAVDAIRRLEEKWVKIRTMLIGDTVLIQVIDSGDGIPAQLAERVMTPFFTTKPDGTGLGLSLSRSIVRAHQGDIVINRNIANTCFEVRLPKLVEGVASGAAQS